MFPKLTPTLSRYSVYLLVWILTFGHYGQSAALVVERSENDFSELSVPTSTTTILARADYEWIQGSVGAGWDSVFTSWTTCGSDPDATGAAVAKEAYADMGNLGATGLAAVFCIPNNACFVATIPKGPSFSLATTWIRDRMNSCAKWKELWGNNNGAFHAEDLAIALAVYNGRTFPFTQEGQTKARMSVYGLYLKSTESKTEDKHGPPGVRWPCRYLSQGRGTTCQRELTGLDIGYYTAPT